MTKKHLSLFTMVACMAIVACAGLFAAKEQGPPGSVQQRLEQTYISTTDIGLSATGAFVAAATLGLGFTVLLVLGDRLRRSSHPAGRVTALLNYLSTAAVRAVRLLLQSHVQTSRSSLAI